MFIYKITCLKNKKIYIGQTTESVKKRWYYHCLENSGCTALKNAIKKHGVKNFKIEIIDDTAKTIIQLNHFEEFYIKQYNSMSPNGYNLKSGGKNGYLSEETKRRIGDSNRGRVCSYEQLEKMSKANKGKIISQETRDKISKTLKEQRKDKSTCPMFGVKHTDEEKYNLKIKGQQRSSIKGRYKGVHFDKSKNLFVASIMVDKKNIFLGYAKEEIQAAILYNKGVLKYFEKGAYLNEIPEGLTFDKYESNPLNSKRKMPSSGYRGVFFDKRVSKWVARITVNKKTTHLGTFSSKHLAAFSYNAYVLEELNGNGFLNIIEEKITTE